MIDLLGYAALTAVIILINVVPALAPPSWLVLSLYKINNPGQDVLTIALVGVIGSVLGRYVMYKYSSVFGNFLPAKYSRNIHMFKNVIDGGNFGPFMTSLLFSLGPLPSNFLFISSGMSGVKLPPLLAGFALGRFASYTFFVFAAFHALRFFSFLGIDLTLASDLIGILATVTVVLIDWKKFLKRKG